MATDWKAELTDLHSRLRTTQEQNASRDHYYHGVLFIDGEPSDELDRMTPNIYATGLRVAERYCVPLTQGGHHLHFVFDDNPDKSDHRLLTLFRGELRNIQRIMRSIPKRVVPPIPVPPQEDGQVENMLHWLYLLHCLGTWPENTSFKTHIEFLLSAADYLEDSHFRTWDECSTVPEFDPITLDAFKRRIGVREATLRSARRAGLRVYYVHKHAYVYGRDWIDYVLNSEDRRNGNHVSNGPEHGRSILNPE